MSSFKNSNYIKKELEMKSQGDWTLIEFELERLSQRYKPSDYKVISPQSKKKENVAYRGAVGSGSVSQGVLDHGKVAYQK